MTTGADVRLVLDAIDSLSVEAFDDLSLDDHLYVSDQLEEAKATLALVAQQIAHRAAARIPDVRERDKNTGKPKGTVRYTANGVTYERHGEGERAPKCIDDEGLWRLVLDTRKVDERTGEVLSPAQLILAAYGQKSRETGDVRLTGATKSKVAALGIDADLFFDSPAFSHFTLRRLS